MKTLKISYSGILTLVVFAILMTSCEQTAATLEDEIIEMKVQDDEIVVSIEDLPVSPEDVWAAANADTNNSNLNTPDEELESRSCLKKIYWISNNYVGWSSNPQYALWIYHYNSSGNYIGNTREDVSSCSAQSRYYSPPSGRCTSVAFVGYQYWGTKTIACR